MPAGGLPSCSSILDPPACGRSDALSTGHAGVVAAWRVGGEGGAVSRAGVAVGCAALVLAWGPRAPTSASATYAPTAAPVSYRTPVAAPVVVVRPFEAPPGPYAAGHRGVDLAASPDDVVLAAGLGRVRFAGPVAGRGVVVIEHPDGVLTEYEPVAPTVSAGAPLSRGQPIGRVRGSHGGCGPSRCLHWSARRDGAYFDPMTLLAGLGPVRLLPWDQARG